MMREILREEINRQFPKDVEVEELGNGTFFISQKINGKTLAMSIKANETEVIARRGHEKSLAFEYVSTAKKSWDAALAQPPNADNV